MMDDLIDKMTERELLARLSLDALARESVYEGSDTIDKAFKIANDGDHTHSLIKFYYAKVQQYKAIRRTMGKYD